jgi:hypothetical protein
LAYSATNRAYHKAKVALLNTQRNFDDLTEDEAKCELDYPSQNSATAVLALCKNSITFPAHLAEPEIISLHTPCSTSSREKKFMYAPYTPEDIHHRSQAFYNRRFSSHDPDAHHACPLSI